MVGMAIEPCHHMRAHRVTQQPGDSAGKEEGRDLNNIGIAKQPVPELFYLPKREEWLRSDAYSEAKRPVIPIHSGH